MPISESTRFCEYLPARALHALHMIVLQIAMIVLMNIPQFRTAYRNCGQTSTGHLKLHKTISVPCCETHPSSTKCEHYAESAYDPGYVTYRFSEIASVFHKYKFIAPIVILFIAFRGIELVSNTEQIKFIMILCG